ncbi:hypothetical protein TNCV_2572251 [Trichonephila clavipes]|nr:hypothetical protein TNCV_2572251 [Trichonephila clavipes]
MTKIFQEAESPTIRLGIGRKPVAEGDEKCGYYGSKLSERVGLACVIYEEGVEKVTLQHQLRDECSVFQTELLCVNLAVKVIQDSLRQDGTLNFLISTHTLFTLFLAQRKF